jgi:hypothetical protein
MRLLKEKFKLFNSNKGMSLNLNLGKSTKRFFGQ